MADSRPGPGVHEVNIGTSFASLLASLDRPGTSKHKNKQDADALFSFRYNFKPESIATGSTGVLHNLSPERSAANAATSDWMLEFASPDSSAQDGSQAKASHVYGYTGPQTAAKDVDCVLVWDEATQRFTIERLAASFSFKIERSHTSLSAHASEHLSRSRKRGRSRVRAKAPKAAIMPVAEAGPSRSPSASKNRRPESRAATRIAPTEEEHLEALRNDSPEGEAEAPGEAPEGQEADEQMDDDDSDALARELEQGLTDMSEVEVDGGGKANTAASTPAADRTFASAHEAETSLHHARATDSPSANSPTLLLGSPSRGAIAPSPRMGGTASPAPSASATASPRPGMPKLRLKPRPDLISQSSGGISTSTLGLGVMTDSRAASPAPPASVPAQQTPPPAAQAAAPSARQISPLPRSAHSAQDPSSSSAGPTPHIGSVSTPPSAPAGGQTPSGAGGGWTGSHTASPRISSTTSTPNLALQSSTWQPPARGAPPSRTHALSYDEEDDEDESVSEDEECSEAEGDGEESEDEEGDDLDNFAAELDMSLADGESVPPTPVSARPGSGSGPTNRRASRSAGGAGAGAGANSAAGMGAGSRSRPRVVGLGGTREEEDDLPDSD